MAACSLRALLGRPWGSRYRPRPGPPSPMSPLSPGRTSLRSSTPSLASCRSDTNLVVRSPKLFSCRLGVPGGGGACGPASAIAPARRLPSARPGQAGAAATSASVLGRPAAGASVAASASAPRSPREPGAISLRGHGRKTSGPSANVQPPNKTKTTRGSREAGRGATGRGAEVMFSGKQTLNRDLPEGSLLKIHTWPAMDSTAKNEMQPALIPGPEWPEQERAERLARGAALKWASGIFYRPEQLDRLGQYRSREVQRTRSLEARMKSVVQSYLEGVKTGVWQLAQALEAVQEAREALGQAHGLLQGMAEVIQTVEPLREQVAQHKQLQALSQLLPRLQAVPSAVAHTQTLIDAQRLLEAYVSLRELEQLREETWTSLGGLALPIFKGLGPLAEALGHAVEAAVGAAGQLAREDPALLVAAVRVAEVETGRTTSLEQAPRDWRQRCLQALQEGLERVHFGTPLLPGPGTLAGWLEALQVALPAELATAEALIAPCCPPHYKVVQLWAHTLHSGLRRCLQQFLKGPELGAADAFTLLHWVLRVYPGPEMMGSLELGPEADVSQLEPLLTLENIEQLEATFVSKVRASVVQWLQKALDGEVAEWGREKEPDTDPSGFYHSPMPAIVLQILEENVRLTSLVSESLQRRVHDMALSELGAFLRSFSDALIRFSRDHLRGEAVAPHYVPYLLAALNHQSALSSSVSVLQPDGVASGVLAPVEAALEDLQRRICRLVLEALLVELQPLFAALPSRQWLLSPELLDNVCKRTAHFCRDFWRVRNSTVQLLLAEAERTVVLQYLCALMQGRLVCRDADERNQAAERLLHDAAQLRDLFLDLVRACWVSKWVEVSVIGWEPRAGAKPTTTCSGPGGDLSMRAGASHPAKTAKPPRPYDAWPRGGRSAATISRRERGSHLRPLGPARGRVQRAAPGRTQLPAGWPAALALCRSPRTLQPRASTYTCSILLPSLGALCLTPDCPQNKATAPYA
ncbi:exocyst complex component 3-like protein isoform X5 [Pteropus medius]|uniref:exocyst complex component 3-like protein isoform X5 n=1 Tax=Pteropus vampyrus TaxID=132908 RepID=UPI00196BAF64|nr:exocyst complex component 3-like protein isoform X5 [Pteropus giganteus]